MKTKKIVWFGKERILACDGKCNKAWGHQHRPREQFDPDDSDDMALLSDSELGDAPENPGTTEGWCGKPAQSDIGEGEGMNRWCSRECCRSVIVAPGEPITLHDFTKRIYNQPWKHPKP